MATFIETDYFGTHEIASSFCRCVHCKRLTVLSSYSTTRFIKVGGIPLFPAGQFRMLDECPVCGCRGTTTRRRFNKERKKHLADMMDGFAENADNPDNCCHALHTLMVYNEKTWFEDIRKSYGLRFETHMEIQHLIAQGLCRFGEYANAITYCRKAIVLGAGKPAEELMEFCHTLLEAAESRNDLEKLAVQPESVKKAYIPFVSLLSGLVLLLFAQGVSAMRTHRAWLVNGSLQEYTFELDGKAYSLQPGARKQIKLKLGHHKLRMDEQNLIEFDYSFSLIKQLLGKHLLVINPDAMALLSTEGEQGKSYSYGQHIHSIPGIALPFYGFRTMEVETEESQHIGLIRPDTHMQMVEQLQELASAEAAEQYARRALLMDPATAEAGGLLQVALASMPEKQALAFLEHGRAIRPALLPWHLKYQDLLLLSGKRKPLVQEYSGLCKARIGEPALRYLMGRVLENPEDARKFFLSSEQGEGMGGLGYHAIAHNHYIRAEYSNALDYSLKALQKDPQNREFNAQHRSILLALGKYDELLASINQTDADMAEETVLYLTCAGFHREAEAAINRFAAENEGNIAPKLNAIRFHAVGNMNGYLTCLADAGDPGADLKRAYHEQRVADADRLLSGNTPHAWWEHLLLYTLATRKNEPAVAEAHWLKAAAETNARSLAGAKTRSILEAGAAPDVETLRNLDLTPREKAVLCCALAARYPERGKELSALSELYNFNPGYPCLLVKHWNTSRTKPKKRLEPAA